MASVRLSLVACILAAPLPRPAQVVGAPARKQANALRVADGSIRVDGRLHEEVWLRAAPITDFTQKEPIEGCADRRDGRALRYDGGALYVGARMSTRSAPMIQAPLGRRDNSDQAEHIQSAFDTYLDRRSAAMFGVTASGVRLDRFHPTDNEDTRRRLRSRVGRTTTRRRRTAGPPSCGSRSRSCASTRETQTWGVNVQPLPPNLDEEDYWVLVPRTERVFISRFGDLHGIPGIRPTRRIELLPYVAGGSTIDGTRNLLNPFDDGKNLTGRLGGDMKIGTGAEPHARSDRQPGFRAGGSGSRRGQPHGIRRRGSRRSGHSSWKDRSSSPSTIPTSTTRAGSARGRPAPATGRLRGLSAGRARSSRPPR